jgi:hypothetical protein
MKVVENVLGQYGAAGLTRGRIYFAFAVALLTDALQLGLGPVGWAFIDEGMDVIAMLLICWAIGFHILLLPTFIIEFIPGPDMLPTWTGCTAAVVMLRKRKQQAEKPSASPPIEVETEVTPVEPPPPLDATERKA